MFNLIADIRLYVNICWHLMINNNNNIKIYIALSLQ